jgi:hypothetical protein
MSTLKLSPLRCKANASWDRLELFFHDAFHEMTHRCFARDIVKMVHRRAVDQWIDLYNHSRHLQSYTLVHWAFVD